MDQKEEATEEEIVVLLVTKDTYNRILTLYKWDKEKNQRTKEKYYARRMKEIREKGGKPLRKAVVCERNDDIIVDVTSKVTPEMLQQISS